MALFNDPATLIDCAICERQEYADLLDEHGNCRGCVEDVRRNVIELNLLTVMRNKLVELEMELGGLVE
jgi:hypothetical protein